MPTLEINLAKIKQNTANIIKGLGRVELAAVTKCCQSDIKVAQAIVEAGAKIIADSYLQNLEPLKDLPVKKMLLKAPLRSEDVRSLDLIDLIMVSNLGDLKRLNFNYHGKKNIGILLNIETGFGREGLDPLELLPAVKLIKSKNHFSLAGFGTNTACQNGTNPLNQINLFTKIIRPFIHSPLIISGGSSSVLPWALKEQIPKDINQLRIGEAILLGHDTINYKPVANNYTDAFNVKAEVVETRRVKERYQAVIAIGLNHIGSGNLYADDKGIQTDKKYSDYITVHSEQKIDMQFLYFKPDYYALMALFSSGFVEKVYINPNN